MHVYPRSANMAAKLSILCRSRVSSRSESAIGQTHPRALSVSQPPALTNTSGVGTSRCAVGLAARRMYLVFVGSRVAAETAPVTADDEVDAAELMKSPPSEKARRACGRSAARRLDMVGEGKGM
jgi:hypothetical protein